MNSSGSITPFLIVWVTPPPAKKAPKNSKIAAMSTAWEIVNTLLPTEVPIALATSLAPTPYAVKKPSIAAEKRIRGIPKIVNSTSAIQ